MKKRSLTLQGHRTSVSLEDAFWSELKKMAARSEMSMGALVQKIDAERRTANLSSALRLAVLDELRTKTDDSGGVERD